MCVRLSLADQLTILQIIFLPTGSSNQFESFTAELSRIVDSYVKTPWIGPNTWVANLERSRSFQCDIWNIPKRIAALRLDINFNEGGAYEFHNTVIKAKERLHQAMEVRNMSLNENGAAGFAVMNPNSDNLEQLPEYGNSLNTVSRDNGEMMCMAARHNSLVDEMGEQPERRSVQPETPQEAQVESPPSYEEAQQSGNYDGHGR